MEVQDAAIPHPCSQQPRLFGNKPLTALSTVSSACQQHSEHIHLFFFPWYFQPVTKVQISHTEEKRPGAVPPMREDGFGPEASSP